MQGGCTGLGRLVQVVHTVMPAGVGQVPAISSNLSAPSKQLIYLGVVGRLQLGFIVEYDGPIFDGKSVDTSYMRSQLEAALGITPRDSEFLRIDLPTAWRSMD